MSDVSYGNFGPRESIQDSAEAQQEQAQQKLNADAATLARQQQARLRQIRARRRNGMLAQARILASRKEAERSNGTKSANLLKQLGRRGETARHERKQPGSHKTEGDHKGHDAHHAHGHPNGPHAHKEQESPLRRVERMDRDGRQGGGRQQQQQQHEDRPPIVKVKLSKRIAPSAIRRDLRNVVDAHMDEPLRLDSEMRLAWTRTCLSFGATLALDPHAKITPDVLGCWLDLVASRYRHPALRDGARQTGLLGAKHQLQTVQDEPGRRPVPGAGLTERQRDINLLAPLMVLSGERPSTRPQLQLAVNRIRTLLFATGMAVDPAQAAKAARARQEAGRTAAGAAHDDDGESTGDESAAGASEKP